MNYVCMFIGGRRMNRVAVVSITAFLLALVSGVILTAVTAKQMKKVKIEQVRV